MRPAEFQRIGVRTLNCTVQATGHLRSAESIGRGRLESCDAAVDHASAAKLRDGLEAAHLTCDCEIRAKFGCLASLSPSSDRWWKAAPRPRRLNPRVRLSSRRWKHESGLHICLKIRKRTPKRIHSESQATEQATNETGHTLQDRRESESGEAGGARAVSATSA